MGVVGGRRSTPHPAVREGTGGAAPPGGLRTPDGASGARGAGRGAGGCRVQGCGCRVQGGVQGAWRGGAGCREGAKCREQDAGRWVQGAGSMRDLSVASGAESPYLRKFPGIRLFSHVFVDLSPVDSTGLYFWV